MDYRLYHSVNHFMAHHRWVAHVANDVQSVLVIVIAAAAFALWLAGRPGGSHRWKLASASALASAALALEANQLIAKVWHRPRPYEAHPALYHLSKSHDPSFPSDHASAAFAIAFAVFLFDRVLGAFFLAVAVLIGLARVLTGAHYPGDVLAGAAVGLLAALVVAYLGRRVLEWAVRLVERVTDPIVAPAWRALGRR
ncbi:MAG: phosphatase PAP2 family protein [Actinomycetota bacterium]|nr:phosphatase PAP2 family protein [Actinomycetota bacterium]